MLLLRTGRRSAAPRAIPCSRSRRHARRARAMKVLWAGVLLSVTIAACALNPSSANVRVPPNEAACLAAVMGKGARDLCDWNAVAAARPRRSFAGHYAVRDHGYS